jgi:WD40-like Beta Propeller Repeat
VSGSPFWNPRSTVRIAAALVVGVVAFGAHPRAVEAAAETAHVFDDSCAFDPAVGFRDPDGVATDPHGNIYVANYGDGTGLQGRIDIFNPSCEFLTEILDPNGPRSIAVDSAGNVYVVDMPGTVFESPFDNKGSVAVYRPESGAYPPTAASTYAAPETVGAAAFSVAVDQSNGHFYLGSSNGVDEYEPDGSLVGDVDESVPAMGVDVWAANHDLYTSLGSGSDGRVRIFGGTSHALRKTIDGSGTPAHSFDFFRPYLAVDQASGDVYVGDLGHKVVDQFNASGEYVSGLEHSLSNAEPSDVAVDSPYPGQPGYDSPNAGYVYVTSGHTESSSHVYAFKPRVVAPPEIKAQRADEITATAATLSAEVNPGSKATTYHFEYGTAHCSTGACLSSPFPDAGAGSGGSFVAVAKAVSGLQPGTTYYFRLVAENCEEGQAGEECVTQGEGVEHLEGSFTTYPPSIAGLPDQRGYELVTPGEGGARIPTAAAFGISGSSFESRLVAPDGESLIFGTEGGGLPGSDGGGFHDTYRSVRAATGWETSVTSPSGSQAAEAFPNGVSPDHGFAAWLVAGEKGSLAGPTGDFTAYLRGPAGEFGLIGRGSLATDPVVNAHWVAAGASHVIFETTNENHVAQRLEPKAPPNGTTAVYDRTADGILQVVSLKPNEITPSAGENATFEGTSRDGSAVVFSLKEGSTTTMYERRDGATVPIVKGKATFAGISEDGERVFYMAGVPNPEGIVEKGEIFLCEPGSDGCGSGADAAHPIGSGGESTIVNISADGSRLYFVSPRQLDGAKGTLGAPNLYVWDGSTVSFVVMLGQDDVSGEEVGFLRYEGLGLWAYATNPLRQSAFAGLANDPSRTTPDGSVLVFQSRAALTAYDNNGQKEIYRYDAVDRSIACLSCMPTRDTAQADATLRTLRDPSRLLEALPPLSQISHIDNVTQDGRAVFFQSDEALVPGDVDGTTDVYEWEAAGAYGGEGSCRRVGGCLYLISSGRSATPNYLYGMTPDGRDVFIETADTLTGEDVDGGVLSIYDARIGGGFAEPPPGPGACQGDACQGSRGTVSAPPAPASAGIKGSGNVRRHARRCAGHRRGKSRRRSSLRPSRCKHHKRPHRHGQASR